MGYSPWRGKELDTTEQLTLSPALINSILPSFCLVSGNYFPTCTWTMTYALSSFLKM